MKISPPIYAFLSFALLASFNATAGEFQVGANFVPLPALFLDLQFSYCFSDSHYQIGYQYHRFTDKIQNNDRVITTKSRQERKGPILMYLVTPNENDSFYCGIKQVKWAAKETPLIPSGGNGSATDNAVYFGIGKIGKVGSDGYYNLGWFFGPTADHSSPVNRSSSSAYSGDPFAWLNKMDFQVQIGIRF